MELLSQILQERGAIGPLHSLKNKCQPRAPQHAQHQGQEAAGKAQSKFWDFKKVSKLKIEVFFSLQFQLSTMLGCLSFSSVELYVTQ